jgi:hypothetical protein
MTNLPVSSPLLYAVQWFEDRKNQMMFGVPALQPGAGQDFVRQHFKMIAMSDWFGMYWVIDNARAGWDEAHDALCELNAELKHHHRDIPPALDVYTTEALLKPLRRRGRRKSKNALQDVLFVILIAELVKQFDLEPTRNTSTKHFDSACDIVAIAINRTKWLRRSVNYKAIEALWLRWSSRVV